MDVSKLTIPLFVVCSLLTGAAGAGGAYVALKGDIATVSKESAETKAEQKKTAEQVQAQAVQNARVEQKLENLKEGMDRIEKALGTAK